MIMIKILLLTIINGIKFFHDGIVFQIAYTISRLGIKSSILFVME